MANKIPRKAVAALGEGTRLSDLAYARIFEILYDRKLLLEPLFRRHTGGADRVPVGPLRDALKALEAEGALTIHPHTGFSSPSRGWS